MKQLGVGDKMKTLNEILGIKDVVSKRDILKKLHIKSKELDYYNDNHILPDSGILKSIEEALSIDKLSIMLQMGIYDESIKSFIAENYRNISAEFIPETKIASRPQVPCFKTSLGKLYQGDCIEIMSNLSDNSIDLIFADPPFNLDKLYPSKIDDNLKILEYIAWTEKWLSECIRILKPGGSFFFWNMPKWNTYFSTFLNQRLNFKHWIAVDIKYSLPIQGRLYPSHYSLLYYVKGEKANTFKPDRLSMDICSKCFNEIKDYGGYKNKMNPLGINMSDIWVDIPAVRHAKYKGRKDANELSVKLLDRIIEMSSNEGDTVFDPFGGSGTSYIISELKNRKWIGTEIGPIDDITNRFNRINVDRDLLERYRSSYNCLFTSHIIKKRKERDLWTCDSFDSDN